MTTPAGVLASPALCSALLAFANESYDDAAPLFDDAMRELNPSLSSPADEAEAAVRLARAANSLKRGHFTAALADCDVAVLRLPLSAVAHFRRATALFHLDRFDEALQAYQMAQEQGSGQSALAIRKCKAELARTALQRSIQPTPPLPPPPLSSKVSMSWFQSASQVTVTLFAKGLAKDAVTASLDPTHPRLLTARLLLPDSSTWERQWRLFDDAESLRVDLSPYRVELQLHKSHPIEWAALEEGERAKVAGVVTRPPVMVAPSPSTAPVAISSSSSSSSGPAYPSSAKKRVEWREVESEAERMEAEEKPEGDAALQKLFQSIYKDANDDTRRAMIKSFQTSGGTVLSTNWKDVSQTDYTKQREPPKGSEFRDWNSPNG